MGRHEQPHGLGADVGDTFPQVLRVPREEVFDEFRECRPAVRAAEECGCGPVDAVEQVFVEMLVGNLAEQVARRGGDDAGADLDRLRLTDGNDFAELDGPQQFGLRTKGSAAISSRNTVPSSACSSEPG